MSAGLIVLNSRDADLRSVPVASAVVITKGMLVDISSGNAVVSTTGGAFLGIALDPSANGETKNITVQVAGVADVKLANARTFEIGDTVEGVDGGLTVEDATNGNNVVVGKAYEKVSSGTRVKVLLKSSVV